MKLHESFEYSVDPEAVFELTSDPDFRRDVTVSGGGKDVKVTVEPDGDGTRITIVRTQPADLPEFVKKLAGDEVTVKQVERWGAADAQGNRTAKVKVSMVGQPAGMEGTVNIAATSKGSSFTVIGDVKVSVPFLGKKIEPVVAKAIAASVRHEVTEGQKRL